MATQELVTRTLVELADTLVDEFDVIELFIRLTDACCEVFDVSDAGLMLAAPIGSELRLMASTSVVMRDLELYELQSREGPCLDAYRDGAPVANELLRTATTRWPHFAPAAVDAGFESVSAIPMRLRGSTIGALNLFRTNAEPLSELDLAAARAFADVATIAILQHQAALDAQQVNQQLHHALNSRIVIEQAKGMLAERANIDVGEAFTWLRDHARSHNRRIAALAGDILDGSVTPDMMDRKPGSGSPD